MIKQIITFNNLTGKYGLFEGTYLFAMRYIARRKYYVLLIRKLKKEYKLEIEEIKNNIKQYTNDRLNDSKKCKIWVLWYQGYDEMPQLVKKCYESLIKNIDLNKFEIILLDSDNLKKYVTLSDNILKKYNDGKISKTHLSDIIRMELLSNYGGIWIDSTCYFFEHLDEEILTYSFYSIKIKENINFFNDGKWSSYFIAMGKNNCIAEFMKEMWKAYWKKNDYLCDYFLIDIFLEIGYEEIPEIRKQIDYVPFNNNNAMYVLNAWKRKMSDQYKNKISNNLFVKMDWRRENKYKKGTVGEYINKKILQIK